MHRRPRIAWLALTAALLMRGGIAAAQIATDGTLGARATLTGPAFSIPATLGQQFGANLFHSFAQFNLATGESATFSGPGSVGNILARVTGGASTIDGTLRSGIPGANLYFVNPRGILFGANARIDVSGAFQASTASYVRLADGARFDAADPAASVLTSAPPAAFGFLVAPAPIVVAGATWDLAGGRGLGLTAGGLAIRDASLRTRGADLRLEATRVGEIAIDAAAPPPAAVAGDVAIANTQIRTVAEDAAPPGRILIRGGELVLNDTLVQSTNSVSASAPPLALAAAGTLGIAASAVFANTSAGGRGADIALSGRDVLLERASTVQTWSTGGGSAGDMTITASRDLHLVTRAGDADFVRLWSAAFAAGASGAMRLSADSLRIDTAGITSFSQGAGANGAIELRGRSVDIAAGSYVASELRAGSTSAGGGSLDLRASEQLRVGGVDAAGNRSVVQTYTRGAGDAGTLAISAPQIDLENAAVQSFGAGATSGANGAVTLNGGAIRTRGGGFVGASHEGARRGGDLRIAGESLEISGGTEIDSFTRGSGGAGNLDVQLTRQLALSGGGILQNLTFGAGNAGNLTVRAPEITLAGASFLQNQARAGTGNAGSLEIVTDRLALAGGSTLNGRTFSGARGRGADVRIDAGAIAISGDSIINTNTSGTGAGGALTVNARRSIIADQGSITSLAFGAGDAGPLTVAADRIALANGSKINGTAQAGSSGRAATVRVTVGELDVASGSFIDSGSLGTGAAADLTIDASRAIRMDGGSLAASSFNNHPGGRIDISAADLALRRSAIVSSTLADGAGGAISIRADTIDLADAGQILASAGQFERGVLTVGRGGAGTIDVQARNLLRIDGFNSGIYSTAFGTGNAGNVHVSAPSIVLSNQGTIGANTGGAGNAGSVRLDVGALRMTSNATVSSGNTILIEGGGLMRGSGAGGNITVRASGDVELTDGARIVAVTRSAGAAGSIDIEAARVDLRSGGSILATSGLIDPTTFAPDAGSGAAGNLRVVATESFSASGFAPTASSGLYSSTYGSGAGGRITLETPRLSLDNFAVIDASTGGDGRAGSIVVRTGDADLRGGANIGSGAGILFNGRLYLGNGAGGSLDILASGRLRLSDRAELITVARGNSPAGAIRVGARRIELDGRASLNTFSTGTGNAGSIEIDATDALVLTGNSSIFSAAIRADGGNIAIRAGNRVHLRDSGIDAFVATGAGSGGNISIDPTFVILENGRIVASAIGGSGGNISIRTDYLLTSPGSIIDASSTLGLSGTVSISPPRSDVNAGLKPLSAQPLDASALAREACAGRGVGAQATSSLVAAGRGGLAESPERMAASRYFDDGRATSIRTGLRIVRTCKA